MILTAIRPTPRPAPRRPATTIRRAGRPRRRFGWRFSPLARKWFDPLNSPPVSWQGRPEHTLH